MEEQGFDFLLLEGVAPGTRDARLLADAGLALLDAQQQIDRLGERKGFLRFARGRGRRGSRPRRGGAFRGKRRLGRGGRNGGGPGAGGEQRGAGEGQGRGKRFHVRRFSDFKLPVIYTRAKNKQEGIFAEIPWASGLLGFRFRKGEKKSKEKAATLFPSAKGRPSAAFSPFLDISRGERRCDGNPCENFVKGKRRNKSSTEKKQIRT